ncbi:MAG: CAP domain-containing protein [Chloroflexota bacterium]
MQSPLRVRPLALFVLGTVLLLITPPAALGAEGLAAGATAIVSGTDGSGLRVRSGPGQTNPALTTLRDGEQVEITGAPLESGSATWYPVKSSRASGWSNAQYLKSVGSGPTEPAATSRLVYAAPEAAQSGPQIRMFQMLNEARVSRGLNPLAWNDELARASQAHAEDMARRGYMEHTNPEGQNPRDRAAKHGYTTPPRSAWLVIETISARPTVEAAMEWLLTHQQHAGVLLRHTWREVGAAYVQGGPYGQFWVMNFGCRPNVLPTFATVGRAGISVDLAFTNELCSPQGQGEFMGRAVDMQIATSPDFAGADWEPFAPLRTIANPSPRMFVKLRDTQGRTTQNDLALPGVMTAAGEASPISADGAARIR